MVRRACGEWLDACGVRRHGVACSVCRAPPHVTVAVTVCCVACQCGDRRVASGLSPGVTVVIGVWRGSLNRIIKHISVACGLSRSCGVWRVTVACGAGVWQRAAGRRRVECGVTGVSDGGVTGHPGGEWRHGVKVCVRQWRVACHGGEWSVACDVQRASWRHGVSCGELRVTVWPVACHGGVWSAGRVASGLSRVACGVWVPCSVWRHGVLC